MQKLVCSAVTPDRLVAYFCQAGAEDEIFAYLPHIPGLNPFLLRVGDRVEGVVEARNMRRELVVVTRQLDARAHA